MQPKISVIIPVYNTKRFLADCLNSVCGQTLRDIEILCINDRSTDGSDLILRDYAARDSRIVLIDFEQNRGVSAARNAGIESARGEYIGFVDSDDRISPDFLEKLYAQTAGGADIAKGKMKRMKNGLPVRDLMVDFNDDHKKIRENRGNYLYYFYSAIFRRTLITENNIRFDEDLRYSEDLCFLVQAVARANRLAVVDDVYYYYVMNEDSAMNKKLEDSFEFFRSCLISAERMTACLDRCCSDPAVYDVFFQRILTLTRLNLEHFSFSADFNRQWLDSVLARYHGSGDIQVIDRLSEMERGDIDRKYVMMALRDRIDRNTQNKKQF